jgi:hypothetical protein
MAMRFGSTAPSALYDASTGVGDIAVGPDRRMVGPLVHSVGGIRRRPPLPPTRWPASVRSAQLAERDWVLFGPGHGLSELILETVRARGSRRAEPSRRVKSPQPLTSPRPGSASRSCRTTSSRTGLHAAVRSLKSPAQFSSSSRLLVRTGRLSLQRSWRCYGRRRGAPATFRDRRRVGSGTAADNVAQGRILR